MVSVVRSAHIRRRMIPRMHENRGQTFPLVFCPPRPPGPPDNNSTIGKLSNCQRTSRNFRTALLPPDFVTFVAFC